MMTQITQFEGKIEYRFNDRELLVTALTHSSYAQENGGASENNERLEFLGDAFFDAIIGEELYRDFPGKEEGFLSRARAAIVCEKALALEGRRLGVGEIIRLGRGEEKNGGRERESIIADAMEAVIGAVYIDGGFEEAKRVVLHIFRGLIEDAKSGKFIVRDYKTALQEVLQQQGITDIKYIPQGEEGPDHNKTFTVRLEVEGRKMSEGRGKSKKQAEQQAAEAALKRSQNVI
ncbi:MAG: ribonuclease III [Clostridiales bacterium]|nr:ribonuclease III [Clostridiales bacterium]MDD7036148.1 ribonuclease III [Bacillota bacterium]MDY2921192.1 ribonuclease III [Lentihominibacter sp.]